MLGNDPASVSDVRPAWPSLHDLNDFDGGERNFDVRPIAEDMHVRRLVVARDHADLKTPDTNNSRHFLTINLASLDFK